MSTITNNTDFIVVVKDDGDQLTFRKTTTKFSVNTTDFTIQDGKYFAQLDYSKISAPTSSDIYDLRNQVNAFFP